MPTKFALGLILALFTTLSLAFPPTALAQATGPTATFKTEELDQMLAPVALFPDELLANILMASTYPLDVVQAARWRNEPDNAQLKGEALAKALEDKDWDPSIKALTMFSSVLNMMSDKLEWTQKLGDAFLAQESEVFERIQFLRQKAEGAGHLATNKQQKVTKQPTTAGGPVYIVIEAAEPDIVYVPVYQPTVVYGSWWYPAYPPYYWNWYPGATFVRGFFWGAGYAIAHKIWGWSGCDWHRHTINININRYNNINVNRLQISSNTWQHNPRQRGPVPYRDAATREKFGKAQISRDSKKDFSGFDRARDKGIDANRLSREAREPADGKRRDTPPGADRIREKLGEGSGKPRDSAGDLARSKIGDKTESRDTRETTRKSSDSGASGTKQRDSADKRPSKEALTRAARPAPSAMDVKPRSQVTKHVERGQASRKSAASSQRGGASLSRDRGGGTKLRR